MAPDGVSARQSDTRPNGRGPDLPSRACAACSLGTSRASWRPEDPCAADAAGLDGPPFSASACWHFPTSSPPVSRRWLVIGLRCSTCRRLDSPSGFPASTKRCRYLGTNKWYSPAGPTCPLGVVPYRRIRLRKDKLRSHSNLSFWACALPGDRGFRCGVWSGWAPSKVQTFVDGLRSTRHAHPR